MSRSVSWTQFFCAPALLASSLLAQQLPQDVLDSVPHGIARDGDRVVALGAGFQASFETGSVVVTPLLGARAPRSMPLRMTFDSLTRGNTVISRGAGDALPSFDDRDKVIYSHANGVVEQYVDTAAGLKQSFVIDQRPAGQGDLVVLIAVETELESSMLDSGVAFNAPGLGGLKFGAVVGIDAEGRRAQGRLEFDGAMLRLSLPGGFVDTAVYPLDLDPLIGGTFNTGRSFNDFHPDSAYDKDWGVFCVVFQSDPSQLDANLFAVIIDGVTGAWVHGPLPIAGSGVAGRAERGAVANSDESGRFFIVWEDDSAGNEDIRGRSVAASDGSLSPVFDIAVGPHDEATPDVGGTTGTSPGNVVVTWDDSIGGIYGASIDNRPSTFTHSFVVAPRQFLPVPDPMNRDPAISKSDYGTGQYLISYTHGNNILGVIPIDASLNFINHTCHILTTGSTMGRSDVDGDGVNFVVAFEVTESLTMLTRDIKTYGVTITGNPSVCPVQTSPLIFEGDAGEDESHPAVANLGSMFAIAWINEAPGANPEIHVANAQPLTAERCSSASIVSSGPEFFHQQPSLSSKLSGGAVSDEALLSYRALDTTVNRAAFRSQFYRAFGGGPVSTISPGCGVGGVCGVNGPFAVGNEEFRLSLTGANPFAAFSLLMIDVFDLPVVNDCLGICSRIDPQATFFKPLIGGRTDFPLPIPCDTALLGLVLKAQWFVVDPNNSGCPLLPELHLSTAICMVLDN